MKRNKALYAFIIAVAIIFVAGVVVFATLAANNKGDGSASANLADNLDESISEEKQASISNNEVNDVISDNNLDSSSDELYEDISKKDIIERALEYTDDKKFVFKEAKKALSTTEEIFLLNEYANALSMICEGQIWVDDTSKKVCDYLGYWNYEDAEMKDTNTFAVYDIDNDGVDELIVEVNNASAADKILVIYQYDFENNTFYREASFYPGAVFYDNDIVFDEWSHNQGVGDFIWPYSVYQYDKEADTYNFLCQVDSWNKEILEDGFPSNVDVDNDGNVVIISKSDGTIYLDNKDYYKWITGVSEGSRQKYYLTKPMFYDNFREYSTDYVEFVTEKILSNYSKTTSDNKVNDIVDLGTLFVLEKTVKIDEKSKDNAEIESVDFDKIEELVQEKAAGNFKDVKGNNKKKKQRQITIDKQKILTYTISETGPIKYEKAIEGLVIFGVAPDMTKEEIDKCLYINGFKEDDYGNYRLGSSGWHLEISVTWKDVEGDLVAETISLSWKDDFAKAK